MQGFIRATALAVGLAAMWCAPALAQSHVGPCPQGAAGTTCDLWTGKVTFIGDGDTVSVDLAGDGTKKPVRVRVTGIQAMEESTYTNKPKDRTGECHANEATARLEQIIKASKGKVQLAAQNPDSHSGNRLRREVAVRMHSSWRDVGRMLVKEGHALWLANGTEWAWNRAYSTIAQQAATRDAGLWNPEYCGFGPPANVRLWVNSDPEGADVDGEWIKIKNNDPVTPLPLANWWVRDSGLRRYTLPADATVAPGGTITVWVGEGIDTPPDFFWNLRHGVFDNVNSERAMGDGAYLFDPDGDLRAASQYPCRYQCTDALRGLVSIDPHYAGTEYIRFRNISSQPIDLENHRVESKPDSYVFGPDSVLQPGEEMRLNVKGSPANDTHLQRFWGKKKLILNNSGDAVTLSSLTYVRVGCYSWGDHSC